MSVGRWLPRRALPYGVSAMCVCAHHWTVHAESGTTNADFVCHGYVGSDTPGPLRAPCRCVGFRPFSGPWDSRTGEPAPPLPVVQAGEPANSYCAPPGLCTARDSHEH